MKFQIEKLSDHAIKMRDFVLDLFFPIECLGCGKEGKWMCKACLNKLPFNSFQLCPVCKKTDRYGRVCPGCAAETSLDGVMSPMSYENILIAKAIKTFKYKFIIGIKHHLADIAISYIENMILNSKNDMPGMLAKLNDHIVIPVPLHRKRKRWRGFNQSEEIAELFAAYFNIKLDSSSLIRTKNRPPQADLKGAERRKNLKDCFEVKNPGSIKDKAIILIDDVFTTGSTLNECAKALKAAGAGEVWGLIIARG